MGKEIMNLNDFKKPLDNPHEVRAEERNAYLPVWKKIFCPVTVNDIYNEEKDKGSVLEEAQEINRAADKLVQENKAKSYTEAVEILIQTDFKTKNSLEIQAEEKARAGALKFSDLMNLNEFEKAASLNLYLGGKESPIEKKHQQARINEIGDPTFSYGTGISSENSKSWREDISMPSYGLFEQYKNEIIKQKFAELKESTNEELLKKFTKTFSYYLKKLDVN